MAGGEADSALQVLPPRLQGAARRMLIAATGGAPPRWEAVAEVAAVLAGPEMRVVLEQERRLDDLDIGAS